MSETEVVERQKVLADVLSRRIRDSMVMGIPPTAVAEAIEEMLFPCSFPPWKVIKRNSAENIVEHWLRQADMFKDVPELREIADLTRWFSISAWAHKAISSKWSDADLFAMDDGLIGSIKRMGGRCILNIDPEGRITLMKSGEMVYLWPQKTKNRPWWEDKRAISAMVKHQHETREVVMREMNAPVTSEKVVYVR